MSYSDPRRLPAQGLFGPVGEPVKVKRTAAKEPDPVAKWTNRDIEEAAMDIMNRVSFSQYSYLDVDPKLFHDQAEAEQLRIVDALLSYLGYRRKLLTDLISGRKRKSAGA